MIEKTIKKIKDKKIYLKNNQNGNKKKNNQLTL